MAARRAACVPGHCSRALCPDFISSSFAVANRTDKGLSACVVTGCACSHASTSERNSLVNASSSTAAGGGAGGGAGGAGGPAEAFDEEASISSRPPRGSPAAQVHTGPGHRPRHRRSRLRSRRTRLIRSAAPARWAERALRCAANLCRQKWFAALFTEDLGRFFHVVWGRSDAPLPLAPDRAPRLFLRDAPQRSLACFPINPYASLRLARTHLFPLVASQRTHRRQDAPWSGFTLRSQGQAARHRVSRRDRGDGAHALTH